MEQFMERLIRSRSHFEEFARKQAILGVDIYTPPINDAQTHAARWAHRDSKDGVLLMAVEHKRRGISFTDRDSFPYDTVIVDEVYKIDDKPHPCLIYICENAAGTHAAVVYGWTRCNWLKENRYDAVQDRHCDFYTCPKDMVRFCKSEEVFVCLP